jgi:hypothetical protein
MTHTFKLARRAARFRTAAAVAAVIGLGACDNADRLGPLNPADAPIALADTAPADSTAIDSLLLSGDTLSDAEAEANEALPEAAFVTASRLPGMVYGSFDLDLHLLGSPYNGMAKLPSPRNIIWLLASARARGGRVIVKLGNHDRYNMNSNHTFNLTKWKREVLKFKNVRFDSYIKDGTLMGHFLIDEPYDASNWGGRKIPQKTVEEMAKFSKKLWPGLTTFVRAPADYLAATGIKYKYLDAGWAMYEHSKSRPDARKWIRSQVAAANRATIKLIVGLNVLNGGTKASRIRGPHRRFVKYSMSASQVKSWGSILMAESRVCGFFNWKYSSKYNRRSDIKKAMAYLAARAKSQPKSSCRG